jgi:hypothetical protein
MDVTEFKDSLNSILNNKSCNLEILRIVTDEICKAAEICKVEDF